MSKLLLRQSIIEHCLAMNESGLNQGTSGNISIRDRDRMLITPSGIPYARMQTEDIASMPLAVERGHWDGPCRPSTEWPMHFDIMMARPEVGAIVHAHSTFATILSILRQEIPAVHYMIAAFGGASVRCAEYATFGTDELSHNALVALQDREACLLANHGMLALGKTLEQAMWCAVELETLARQYYHSLLLGGGHVLPDTEIAVVQERFKYYVPQD
ncbi:MAG TPA: class II aldolase [Gammaproteobacteria bacterium]|nr:class II aldolase [Gammaproteobacteria bacterium]